MNNRYLLLQLLITMLFCMTIQPVFAYVPKSDDTVVTKLPWQLSGFTKRFTRKSSAAGDAPDLEVIKEVEELIHISRQTGDVRFSARASSKLEPLLTSSDTIQSNVLFLHAVLLQQKHNFKKAIAVLERILRTDPGFTQAWLNLATIHRAAGQYPQAELACKQIKDRAATLIYVGCIADLLSLTGRGTEALALLQKFRPLLRRQPTTAIRWYATSFAQTHYRLGNDEQSEFWFHLAMKQSASDDIYLLTEYLDLLLYQKRYQDVLDLTQPRSFSAEIAVRRAFAQVQMNNDNDAVTALESLTTFDLTNDRDDWRPSGAEARYQLWFKHQPERAVEIAHQLWLEEKEPSTALFLHEVATIAKRNDLVQASRNWLQRAGIGVRRYVASPKVGNTEKHGIASP